MPVSVKPNMEDSEMSVLKKLNLTDHAKKSARIVDPVMRSRTKFAAALQTQVNIVEAEAKGKTHTVERMRWKTNEDGERVRVPTQISPRPWFWEEDGVVYLMPKIGVRPLEIEKGKSTIKVGTKKELLPTLNMLIQAVNDAELDGQIAAVNSRSKSK